MLGKVTPLLPNALCLFHSIVHELFFADHKFASAGREDVDVRMLGSGMLAPHVFQANSDTHIGTLDSTHR